MNRPLVLVSQPLPAGWLDALAGSCEVLSAPAGLAALPPEIEARLAEVEGLFCLLTERVDQALLDRLPRLRVVSNMAVGLDNIDLAACTRRGLPVGHTPGVLTASTADLTLALLLAAARRLPEAAADARAGRWTTWTPDGWLGLDLDGRTLGLVGLGKIGQAVAQRAHAFGLRLLYANRSPRPEAEQRWGAQPRALDELLAESDFVSLHVPLTPETRGLIHARALRRMRPSAWLINAARGPIVDTPALLQALTENWIAGAALDVTDPEPLPAGHSLYAQPNCLVLPHIGSATHGARRAMAERACHNLLAGLTGERLPFCANPAVYN